MLDPNAYVRKLYNQELGFRDGVPGEAGRYFFVSKEYTGYFPPLSTVIKNDFVVIKMIPPTSNDIVLTKYVYHNSKICEHQANGRDEYRIYLNQAIEPGGEYFKINDIVVICKNISEENVSDIQYKIYNFPAQMADSDYRQLERLLHQYAPPRAKDKHALVPISALPFITSQVVAAPAPTVIPTAVVNAVLDAPVLPISEDQMRVEYEFTRTIREGSFQDLVKYFYEYKCAVTRTSINYKDLYNLEAAHIIPDSHNGPAHPKNGISLCRDMYWAFDKGFFTVGDDYKIKVHNKVKTLPVLSPFDGKDILLPSDLRARPSALSLKYHRENIFGIFELSV